MAAKSSIISRLALPAIFLAQFGGILLAGETSLLHDVSVQFAGAQESLKQLKLFEGSVQTEASAESADLLADASVSPLSFTRVSNELRLDPDSRDLIVNTREGTLRYEILGQPKKLGQGELQLDLELAENHLNQLIDLKAYLKLRVTIHFGEEIDSELVAQ